MLTTVLILLVIAAILLTIAILVQNPKGGGLSSEFGGGATSQMFGVQRTGDLIENMTWGLFTFLIVGSLAIAIFLKPVDAAIPDSTLDVESSQTAPVTPTPSPLPTAPGAQPTPATPAN